MASELITGFAGTPHVGSDDMGAFQAGILGTGSYVLQTGQQLKATVASSNKVTIGTGDLVMNGRHVRMATATDLTIQNGTQGQKRNDLIVCRYSKASDGKETAALTVVKGTATTGTPADPSYNKTSILDGASVSDMPLYRIPITNLSVGTPIQLFKVLTPLGTVGDSVTHRMVRASFNRSDGQNQVNNGQTLMSMEIRSKDIQSAHVQSTGNGGEIRGLDAGHYLVMASLPVAVNGGWFALSIDISGDATVNGNSVGEVLSSSNGYARLNAEGVVHVTGPDDGIWVRCDSNATAQMRSRGGLLITRI